MTAYDGGEIGKETSVKFDAFRTTKVRLHITDGNNPSIYEFQLFYQEGADQSGTIAVTRPEVLVQTGSTNAGCTVYEEAPFEIAGTYEGEAADAEVVVQEEGQEERFQGSLNPDGSWSVQVDALPTGKITVSAILKNSDGGTVAVSDEKNAIIRNGKDLARNKETEVTTGYNNLGGDQAVDGRTGTRWAPNDSDPKPALTVKLGEPTQFNRIIMREMFDRWNTSIDYRCKKFKLEYLENDSSGEWKPLAEGTDIGEEYVLNLNESVTASQIRVTMDECSVVNGKTYMASLETFEVYYIPRTTEPVEPEDPIDVRTADSIIETRDYQKANVKGTASANDNAPDHTSYGGEFKAGDYLVYQNIDFGQKTYQTFMLMISALTNQKDKKIELRLDAVDGEKIGEISVTPSGERTIFKEQYAEISGSVTGQHDIYLVFPEDAGLDMDFFTFSTYNGSETEEETRQCIRPIYSFWGLFLSGG